MNLVYPSPSFTNLVSSTPFNPRLPGSKSHSTYHFQFPFFKKLLPLYLRERHKLTLIQVSFDVTQPPFWSPRLPVCSEVEVPPRSPQSLLVDQLTGEREPTHRPVRGCVGDGRSGGKGRLLQAGGGQGRKRCLSPACPSERRWVSLFVFTVSHYRLDKTCRPQHSGSCASKLRPDSHPLAPSLVTGRAVLL